MEAGPDPRGHVVVERPAGGWRDRLGSYVVKVDGVEVGRVRAGGKMSAEIAPGTHEVQAFIDWTSSEPVVVEVPASGETYLVVEPGGNALQAYQMFLNPGSYLRLRPA